jgi:hypothetical protein
MLWRFHPAPLPALLFAPVLLTLLRVCAAHLGRLPPCWPLCCTPSLLLALHLLLRPSSSA